MSEDCVYLKRSLIDSEKVNGVSIGAETLFVRLLAAANQHRYPADPKRILYRLYTARYEKGSVNYGDVEGWMGELLRVGLVVRVQDGKDEYLQINNPVEDKIKATKPPVERKADRFEEFWRAWPKHHRKVDKPRCLKYWRERRYDEIADRIMSCLSKFKQSHDWVKNGGEFIPGPCPWLNKEPWQTDEEDLFETRSHMSPPRHFDDYGMPMAPVMPREEDLIAIYEIIAQQKKRSAN